MSFNGFNALRIEPLPPVADCIQLSLIPPTYLPYYTDPNRAFSTRSLGNAFLCFLRIKLALYGTMDNNVIQLQYFSTETTPIVKQKSNQQQTGRLIDLTNPPSTTPAQEVPSMPFSELLVLCLQYVMLRPLDQAKKPS